MLSGLKFDLFMGSFFLWRVVTCARFRESVICISNLKRSPMKPYTLLVCATIVLASSTVLKI